jgi:DNA primase
MIKDILEDLGYKPQSSGSQWLRMTAAYRNGTSLSLAVNKETGWFEDFVTGHNGPLFKLVMLTLGIGEQEARNYLEGSYFAAQKNNEVQAEKIEQQKFLPPDFCDDLLPSYSFYKKRGIEESVLKEFGGGVKTYGKMNNRFVFPIYDFNKKIIGVAGRDLFQNSVRTKWKIMGRKNKFLYPHHLTKDNIESSGEVILVESIGDALALYNAGIKNFLVTFGLSISKDLILYLIRLNVTKIIIATNNDVESKENRGLSAANNIKAKLQKFFQADQVRIVLPCKKDFGEMTKEEIANWNLRAHE